MWFTPAIFSRQHIYVLCMRTSLCTVDAEVKVVGPQQTHVLFCAIRTSVPHPSIEDINLDIYLVKACDLCAILTHAISPRFSSSAGTGHS